MLKFPLGHGLFSKCDDYKVIIAGSLSVVGLALVAGIAVYSLMKPQIESAFSKKGGYYGLKSKEFNSLVTSLGMTWKSHHVLGAPFKLPPDAKMPTDANGQSLKIPPMRNLKENMQELVDEVAEAGIPFLVCANTPINTMDDIKSSLEVLANTGEACKKSGIQFCYHNHDAEFKQVDGHAPYDMMLEQLDKDDVKFELDLAWAVKGGVDPVSMFNHHTLWSACRPGCVDYISQLILADKRFEWMAGLITDHRPVLIDVDNVNIQNRS